MDIELCVYLRCLCAKKRKINKRYGKMSERLKVPALNTGELKGFGGSNPPLPANRGCNAKGSALLSKRIIEKSL